MALFHCVLEGRMCRGAAAAAPAAAAALSSFKRSSRTWRLLSAESSSNTRTSSSSRSDSSRRSMTFPLELPLHTDTSSKSSASWSSSRSSSSSSRYSGGRCCCCCCDPWCVVNVLCRERRRNCSSSSGSHFFFFSAATSASPRRSLVSLPLLRSFSVTTAASRTGPVASSSSAKAALPSSSLSGAATAKHLVSVHPEGTRLDVAGVPLRSAAAAADIEVYVQQKIRDERTLNRRLVMLLLLCGAGVYVHSALGDVSSFLYSLYEPCVSLAFPFLNFGPFDPENAHALAIQLAARGFVPADYDKDWPAMAVELEGLRFANPVGLAAGFDKNAEAVLPLLRMGFGFVEVGTITPEPQEGNPRPRIFRLFEDRAIINRCGFNSKGAAYAEQQLREVARKRWTTPITSAGVIGINIGKNKTANAVEDVKSGIQRLARYADYLVINLSSPNTPGLRALQQQQQLTTLVDAAQQQLHALEQQQESAAAAASQQQKEDKEETQDRQQKKPVSSSKQTAASSSSSSSSARETLSGAEEETVEDVYLTQRRRRPLLFLKIAPDLTMKEKIDIAEVVLAKKVDGLVVTNTTVQRPTTLRSSSRNEAGGLSGTPLKEISTQCVYDMYRLTGGKVFIIATGGVECGRDALEKIEAGASLVEIYTSLIYKGPQVARQIKNELYGLLNAKGYHDIKQAVGAKHRATPKRKVPPPTFD